jgi:hypothetical protein
LRLFLVVALSALAGCDGEDVHRLSRVYRRLTDNFRASTGPARDRLADRLSSLQGGEAGLAARVAARLRWDLALRGAEIEVGEEGDVIELRGRVPDEAGRRRAVDLAESTEGVEKVVDELTVAGGQ